MSDQPILTFENHGPITLGRIEAASVLDAVNVTQLGSELMNYVEKKPGIRLLLDFEHVDYLSSAVLTELLRINKVVNEKKGSLRLCSLNQDIRKVFEITNLDRMFVIYGDCDDGVRKFQRSLAIEAQEEAWGELGKEG
jgi:anti-sigma B factor antagonist